MDYQYEEQAGYPMPAQSPYVRVEARDPNFNQWFLDNSEAITSLKMYWRGFEKDENGNWSERADSQERRLMNDKGIHWAIQLMESFLSKPNQYTNWDREEMNYEMRQVARMIWRGLTHQYLDFGLTKINAYVIGKQMFAQIHAIMLSARGEGIRNYLGRVQQIQEIRQTGDSQRRGFMSSILGVFNRRGMN